MKALPIARTSPDETLMLSVWKIGEWTAHPATNELRRGDEAVRLEPKAMDLLMALARRPGAVASREELLAEVWPGMVVGDEALSQGITKLRRALGDDSRSPRYIETISKRGYRLLATVGGAPAGAARRSPRTIPRPLLAAVAFSVMMLAVLLLLFPREPAPPPPPTPTSAPPHGSRSPSFPSRPWGATPARTISRAASARR
jgi:DNA-binding winged helix-turn-helix (wHTH) protein